VAGDNGTFTAAVESADAVAALAPRAAETVARAIRTRRAWGLEGEACRAMAVVTLYSLDSLSNQVDTKGS